MRPSLIVTLKYNPANLPAYIKNAYAQNGAAAPLFVHPNPALRATSAVPTPATGAAAPVMPTEAVANGSATRVYINAKITPYLMEAVKFVAMKR